MKIVKVEDVHCDAGWRVNSFLKVTTDEGIVGWAEYMEGYGAQGLTSVIHKLADRVLIGRDPRPVESITAFLYAATRQAPGGINQQAIGAIENALVDIKAKALGVPVCEMLGGPVRDRLHLYWSHCGTYRARHAERIKEWTGADPVRSLDDLVRLGVEVRTSCAVTRIWPQHVEADGTTIEIRQARVSDIDAVRDMHAATQHLLVSPVVFRAIGKELAGLATTQRWVLAGLVDA